MGHSPERSVKQVVLWKLPDRFFSDRSGLATELRNEAAAALRISVTRQVDQHPATLTLTFSEQIGARKDPLLWQRPQRQSKE
jgi:hypothetical protein